jgi:hypothetical protein
MVAGDAEAKIPGANTSGSQRHHLHLAHTIDHDMQQLRVIYDQP